MAKSFPLIFTPFVIAVFASAVSFAPPPISSNSDEQALLRAIHAHPEEDTPRLVYADWLDEQGGEGNADRAEFIRLQIKMSHPLGTGALDEAWQRSEALLKKWREQWLPKSVLDMEKTGVKIAFHRGFPEYCNITLPSSVDIPLLFRELPFLAGMGFEIPRSWGANARHYDLTLNRLGRQFEIVPEADRLRMRGLSLNFGATNHTPRTSSLNFFDRLARRMPSLTSLALIGLNQPSGEPLHMPWEAAIRDLPGRAYLERLTLTDVNVVSPPAILLTVLGDGKRFPRLDSLHLDRVRIPSLAPFHQKGAFPQLTELVVRGLGQERGAGWVSFVSQSPVFPRLQIFHLSSEGIASVEAAFMEAILAKKGQHVLSDAEFGTVRTKNYPELEAELRRNAIAQGCLHLMFKLGGPARPDEQ